ncbi:MAG: hypothetical protein ACRD5W_14805 [Candidatus Acidiferrales bacterium]
MIGLAVFTAAVQAQEVVGHIEGQTFTASGQVRVERDPSHNRTTLLSGSEVVVHEGHARLVLTDGSEVDVCGPAKISLLQSGGALTLALDYGRVHGRLAPSLTITIYTASATATPVAIGGSQRDVVVGLEPQGELCVNAALGAVRLEHQFTGETLLAPQNAELTVDATSLDSIRTSPGVCRCDPPPDAVMIGVTKQAADAAKSRPPQPEAAAPVPTPIPSGQSAAATRNETEQRKTETRVIAVMPPLTFDAKAPQPSAARPAPARPEVVQIIREVRVLPAAVFTGKVQPRAGEKPAQPPERADAVAADSGQKKPSLGARLKHFFGRLFGRKPKP